MLIKIQFINQYVGECTKSMAYCFWIVYFLLSPNNLYICHNMKNPAIDRKKGPAISVIRNIKLPNYDTITLDNGIQAYLINLGTQALTKIDVVFESGRHIEQYRTQSKALGSLLKEGSKKHDADFYAQLFDFHGASYYSRTSLDYISAGLFCLTKHVEALTEHIFEIISEPVFPKLEIDRFIKTCQQKLKLSLSKNDINAYRELTSQIFGDDHVYGYNSKLSDFEQINQPSLIQLHKDMLTKQDIKIFVSGRFNSTQIHKLLNRTFGSIPRKKTKIIQYTRTQIPKLERINLPSHNKHQVALRLGKLFGSRQHHEYNDLFFLSNVLGGFFGSRLMKNIREDKGYTYNIFSDIDAMKYDGYFYITTELDKRHLNATLKEIEIEFDRLKNEKISAQELEMNKNYILGNMLHITDGPFQIIKLLKSLKLNDLTDQDFNESIQTLANMTTEQIQAFAQSFLNFSEFSSVVIGDVE